MAESILDRNIRDLGLSTRTVNCLIYEGIGSLREVIKVGADELIRIPNFGRKSLNEINEILSSEGIAAMAGKRQRYFGIRLPEHIFVALELRAKSNDRMIETEAAILIGTALGDPPPAESIPERVARLERLVDCLVRGEECPTQ